MPRANTLAEVLIPFFEVICLARQRDSIGPRHSFQPRFSIGARCPDRGRLTRLSPTTILRDRQNSPPGSPMSELARKARARGRPGTSSRKPDPAYLKSSSAAKAPKNSYRALGIEHRPRSHAASESMCWKLPMMRSLRNARDFGERVGDSCRGQESGNIRKQKSMSCHATFHAFPPSDLPTCAFNPSVLISSS